MAELTNEYLLVSSAGTVLDAGDVRIAPPLAGEAAYSLETQEDVAAYGAEHGAQLELGGGGLKLESDELEDYLLVDVETGAAYRAGAGWLVVSSTDSDQLDLDDPAAVGKYAAEHSVGAPTAPADVLKLKGLPFESVL